MPRKILYDDNIESLLKELDTQMRSVRSRAQVFKKNNPALLQHALNPYRDITTYDPQTGKLTFDFNLTDVRKELKNVHPSMRESILRSRIHYFKGKTQARFSRYSDTQGQFGTQAHNKVKKFFDEITPEQASKVHKYFDEYNYVDEYSLVDFVDDYYTSPDNLDSLIEQKLS